MWKTCLGKELGIIRFKSNSKTTMRYTKIIVIDIYRSMHLLHALLVFTGAMWIQEILEDQSHKYYLNSEQQFCSGSFPLVYCYSCVVFWVWEIAFSGWNIQTYACFQKRDLKNAMKFVYKRSSIQGNHTCFLLSLLHRCCFLFKSHELLKSKSIELL